MQTVKDCVFDCKYHSPQNRCCNVNNSLSILCSHLICKNTECKQQEQWFFILQILPWLSSWFFFSSLFPLFYYFEGIKKKTFTEQWQSAKKKHTLKLWTLKSFSMQVCSVFTKRTWVLSWELKRKWIQAIVIIFFF